MRKLPFLGLTFMALNLVASCVHSTECKDKACQDEYETQVFTFQETIDSPRHVLCKVSYYVNDDTLFTNERYHFVNLIYSSDSTGEMSYMHMIVFDRNQKPDVDGWYHLTFADEYIPRISGTHLTGIVRRNYYGPLYDASKHTGHPDAYLYNETPNTTEAPTSHSLTPQLKKLLPYIK